MKIRALYSTPSYLYVVHGQYAYRVDTSDVVTYLGSLDTATSHVKIRSNGNQLMFTDGTDGYIYTFSTGSWAKISDGDFPGASDLAYIDGFFVVSKPDSDLLYCSGLYDGTNWDALDFTEAEAAPDNIIGVEAVNSQLYVAGEQTIQVYYNAAGINFPFSPIDGGVIEYGVVGRGSLVVINNNLVWLTPEGDIVTTEGYQAIPISTPQVAYQISTYSISDKENAVAIGYSQNGHTYYVITFATAGKTWAYDFSTGYWAERSSYSAVGVYGKWRGNAYAHFNGKHLIGDFELGNVYELDADTYTDNFHSIERTRIAQNIHESQKFIKHKQLNLDMQMGTGFTPDDSGSYPPSVAAYDSGLAYETGHCCIYDSKYYVSILGSNIDHQPPDTDWWDEVEATLWTCADPQVMISWTDDMGNTWSTERTADIGTDPTEKKRISMRNFGRARNRNYKLKTVAPVKVVVLGADMELEGGRN